MSAGAGRWLSTAARSLVGVAAGAAVVVQLVVLYVPRAPSAPLFPESDKVVHLLVFAVPVLLLLLAGAPALPVVTVFALHAGVSEVVQSALLPHRDGSLWDAVADLTGVALGWGTWWLLRRGAPSSRW